MEVAWMILNDPSKIIMIASLSLSQRSLAGTILVRSKYLTEILIRMTSISIS